MADIKIQTLDIRDFTSGDPLKKAGFVESLHRAYTEIGFVIIKGHPISAEQQNQAYEKIKAFFALPTDTKKKFEVSGIGGARGYTSFGREHAKDHPIGDLKEFFQVGPNPPSDFRLIKEYPQNVSVTAVAGFDETLRKLYDDLLSLGTNMLRAISLILKQPENYFDNYVRYGNSILRPIHYPALTGSEERGAVRSAAHEDINLITLLIGASSPGLEVLTLSGQWLPVTTQPNEIVVNVSDMLQRHSNYMLKSTTHRVVNPPRPRGTPDEVRFSIPFFLHPVSDMNLAALPSCVSDKNPPKDPPILAGDYLMQRLREIGLY